MIHFSKVLSAFAVIGFGAAAQAATIIGTINFSSGPNGGVTLQDSGANLTLDIANAAGVQTWLVPSEVDTRTDSFISVPNGQAVNFSPLPWIFDPPSPKNSLWTIVGPDNFTFNLTSSAIVKRDDFLLIEGIGTLTGTNFDPTPATWLFTTQKEATEGKFAWSSTTTAVPELGSASLLGGALLSFCLLRRRNLT